MSDQDTVEKKSTSRTAQGVVTSNKGQKSAVVTIERFVRHKRYPKYIKQSTKLQIHDPENTCEVGDTVIIRECRPMSKTKSWILDAIKERAK